MKNSRNVLAVVALVLGAAATSLASGQMSPTAVQTAAKSQNNAEAAPQLIFLDTDIGDDIDDAFALALALRSPELKLLGITTAYGDTDLRAKLLYRYLGSLCRFDVNVIPGVPTPHENVFTQAAYARGAPNQSCGVVSFHSYSKVDEERLAKQRKADAAKLKADQAQMMAAVGHLVQQRHSHDAAGFLFDEIRAHPGEITLIAIGPLFNIQAAIERDPATFRQLKRVVLMGGSIHRGYDGQNGERRPPDAEWNINRDPAGLKALLNSGVPVFMMPLDSTQIHLETKERELIFSHGSPLTDQLTLLYHQWMDVTPSHPTTPTLFDPVAVAYAIRPELCPVTPMRLEVDDKGFTRPVDGAPTAQVCLQSDENVFLKFLMERITSDSDPAPATPATPVSAN
jgi:inosine-uridine nucleoside N-ribohydrolase